MKVLIVEDEYYARKRLVKMVQEWDSEVIVTGEVETGIEAITSIRHEPPDMVLTDIRMPEMDGLELSRYVKKHFPSILLAILSGYADFEYAKEAISCDVKGFLLKPIKHDELSALLGELRQTWKKRNSDRQQYNALIGKLALFNGQVERLYDRKAVSEVKEGDSQRLINDIVTYVQENYASEISLDDLAKHRYYLNSSYLSRLFKAKTGQRFSDFLTACRMKKAKQFLETNGFSIYEIASLVGYTSPSYFIQMFKRYYGETPGNYQSK